MRASRRNRSRAAVWLTWGDLDGDVAVELHVAREVDHSHAAAAELALERVLTGQGGLQVEEFGGRLRHHVNTTQEKGAA
jgi:hypothetical protein